MSPSRPGDVLSSVPVKVHLFVPCLVDQLLPHVGEATVRVLRRVGCEVIYDPHQVCCGQPAFNAGYTREAAAVARTLIGAFRGAEVVVAPSGSCVAMVRNHWNTLAPHLSAAERDAARSISGRVFELSELLVDHLGITDVGATLEATATYHPSCHLSRDLNVDSAPRTLLRGVRGLSVVDLPDADRCCGFGGAFAVKHPELSTAMGEDKARRIVETRAQLVVTADPGCLLQMRGVLGRLGSSARVVHLAEVLAARGALAPPEAEGAPR